jgi:hypothetical protein
MWPSITAYNPEIAEVHQETVIDCVKPFKTLEGLLVWPWDSYKETVAQQKHALLINQYIDEKNRKDATEDTAMDLEDTPTNGATIREVALSET